MNCKNQVDQLLHVNDLLLGGTSSQSNNNVNSFCESDQAGSRSYPSALSFLLHVVYLSQDYSRLHNMW